MIKKCFEIENQKKKKKKQKCGREDSRNIKGQLKSKSCNCKVYPLTIKE